MIDLSHDKDILRKIREYEDSLNKSHVSNYDKEIELIQELSEIDLKDSHLYFDDSDK